MLLMPQPLKVSNASTARRTGETGFNMNGSFAIFGTGTTR
jgi:hypothetical protein